MKKFISIALIVIILIASFVSCNNNAKETIAVVYETSSEYANILSEKLTAKGISCTIVKASEAIPENAITIYADAYYNISLAYNEASINVLGNEIYLTPNVYLGFAELAETFASKVNSIDDIKNLTSEKLTYDITSGALIEATEYTASTIETLSSSMKNSIINKESFDASKISGKIIYVSNKGNDANDGLTKESAIASISKLNTIALSEGDAVLFERGGFFRGTVSTKSGVTYSNYGEGQLPILVQSKQNYAESNLWTLEDAENNIWKLTTYVRDPGIIVINANAMAIDEQNENTAARIVDIKYESNAGTKYTALNTISGYSRLLEADDLTYYWGTKSTTPESHTEKACGNYVLYLKSEKDPSTFNDIEIGEDYSIFTVGGSIKNVTIDGLCMKYVGACTVSGSGTLTEGLIVQNCVFCWSGGSMIDSQPGTRYGNAIQIFGGCNKFYVKNNYIYQIYDTAVTFQYHYSSTTKPKMINVEISSNLFENCYWATEWWIGRDTDNAAKDPEIGYVEVYNNIMRYSNNSWGTLEHGSAKQSPTTGASIVTGFGSNNVHDFNVYNNIIECSYCEEKPTLNTRLMTISTGDGNANIKYYGNTFLQKEGKLLVRLSPKSGSVVEKKFDKTGVASFLSQTKKDGCDFSDNAYVLYK